ncbi:N-alpha-acetyltransferase 80-like [Daphnia pulicaria]|uniref:N-alpha-acetyltransferase 80-like n=1 Tax=Daphnia pulicaria TaxID=35523 RepID=UPI001EEC6B59|nr:N-alpha-acetyltransferase 80-like [Daphnia pulicaria]
MEKDKVMIVALHDKPDLTEDCAKILNEEWPRSKTARMRTIENSNPNLPISLLLIKNTQQNKDEVVGHAKISRLPLVPGTCLIESVLVNPVNRGKGFGKLLMEECEKLATQFRFSWAILSTHDKQEFYRKLGYEFCQPVCQYGAPPSSASHLLETTQPNKASETVSKTAPCEGSVLKTKTAFPQPPPLPEFTNISVPAKKVYMKKSLKQ